MAQITILNAANAPQGPFTREQVAHKLAAGEFTLNSLAHVEGLTQWTPLRDVLAKVDGPLLPPPVVPPTPTPAYSYAVTMQPPTHLIYAGFWIRFVAYLIDSLILGAGIFVLFSIFAIVMSVIGVASGGTLVGINGSFNGRTDVSPVFILIVGLMELVLWVVIMGGSWLYFAKLESGPQQATIGKRVLGLRVTDLTGQPITFGRATGRFFGKIVSAIPLDIGFIMAGFTERKQALHDMIAGTLVVRN